MKKAPKFGCFFCLQSFAEYFQIFAKVRQNIMLIFAPKFKLIKSKEMNINELLKANANVSVCVSVADLKEFVQQMIVEAAAKPVEAEEKFLTTDEVCQLLNVSSNTLWRWGKSGYLIPHKVGRTPMYRHSDIENLRKGINK